MIANVALNKQNLKKVGVGALIAGAGAVLTYAIDAVPSLELGQWSPVVVACLSILVNFLRKISEE